VTGDPQPLILSVDGGNSKADVALVAADGRLLSAVRGPTISHQAVGLEAGMDRLDVLVERAAAAAGVRPDRPVARLGIYSLAGADYPNDRRSLTRALEARGAAAETIVVNDAFGALRAGSRRGWGVVLICGQGINAAGVAPDGRSARFAAVGDISGDWGGGTSVGMAALAAAVRGRDGRGPRTALERIVPAHFGLARPEALTRALYDERISPSRIGELSPVVFDAARKGDAVARSIVDRLVDELASMAIALIRRLHLARTDVEVVLAGSVFDADDPAFIEGLRERVTSIARRATLLRLAAPPVAGAALLGLDRLAGGKAEPDAAVRLRADLEAWHRGAASVQRPQAAS
jgi:N-acetylglucosamine kinase-like BadF-type ATPase